MPYLNTVTVGRTWHSHEVTSEAAVLERGRISPSRRRSPVRRVERRVCQWPTPGAWRDFRAEFKWSVNFTHAVDGPTLYTAVGMQRCTRTARATRRRAARRPALATWHLRCTRSRHNPTRDRADRTARMPPSTTLNAQESKLRCSALGATTARPNHTDRDAPRRAAAHHTLCTLRQTTTTVQTITVQTRRPLPPHTQANTTSDFTKRDTRV